MQILLQRMETLEKKMTSIEEKIDLVLKANKSFQEVSLTSENGVQSVP